MKNAFLQCIAAAFFVTTWQAATAQANTSLSNLSITSVNQSLLPNSDSTKDLGSNARRWRDIHLKGTLYMNGLPVAKTPRSFDQTYYGVGAGASNTTGVENSAFGYRALVSSTTGSYNSAFGAEALYNNGPASNSNNAFGYAALYANYNGRANNAFGAAALYVNKSGSNNSAFGLYALYSNVSGNGNSAFGNASLFSNVSGSYNVAIGFASLGASKNNSHNIAIGDSALQNYDDGYFEDYMVGIGYNAMKHNTTGYYNTAIGGNTLLNNKAGYGNTVLGAFADASAGDLYNATAIGYAAKVDMPNKVRIGNTFVNSIGGQVGWTIFSDGRYKKNIREDVQGLAFINSLRPVTYTVDVKGVDEYYNKGAGKNSDRNASGALQKAADEASRQVHNGFIAQEVEEAAKKLNYNFSGVDKPQTKEGLYGLRYSDFVVPLVKAVQELSRQNDELKKQNEYQQKEIESLKAMVISGSAGNSSSKASSNTQAEIRGSGSLQQNNPNPFHQSSTIRYSLPATVTSAKMVITDYMGKVLKQVNIASAGVGAIEIEAGSLSSGTYNYSLIADDQLVDTKKMIITK